MQNERTIQRSAGVHTEVSKQRKVSPKALAAKLLPNSLLGALAYRLGRPGRSYGSYGEDLQLGPILRSLGITDGLYVDIGAFHPKLGSNTYFLHAQGWTGVNVDVDAYKLELFERFRPNDTNIVAGVSAEDGEATVYRQDRKGFGSMTSLDKVEAERAANQLGTTLSEAPIDVLSLNTLLDTHGPKTEAGEPQPVGVLNIDVENHEFEILRTFDFDTYRPRVLLVEIHADRITDLQESPVYKLLQSNGYEMVSWPAATCIFVHGSDLEPQAVAD